LHRNPRGEEYWWIGLPAFEWEKRGDVHMSDLEAVHANYVSITPIHLDMTSYEDIKVLEKWI